MNTANPLNISYQTINQLKRLAVTARGNREGEMALDEAIRALHPEEQAQLLTHNMLGRPDEPIRPPDTSSTFERQLHPLVVALNAVATDSIDTFEILPESNPSDDQRKARLSKPLDPQDWRTSWMTSQFGPDSESLVTFRLYTQPRSIVGGLRMSWLIVEHRNELGASDVQAEIDRIVGLFDQQLNVGRPKDSATTHNPS